MKKILFNAAALLAMCSCSNPAQFVINGDVADLTGTVYLFDGKTLIDSAVVNEGKFQFKGVAETPGTRILMDSREGQPVAFALRMIVEPGTIQVKSDATNVQDKHVTGTPANDASNAYKTASQVLIQEFRSEVTTDERREAIEGEFEQLTRTTIDANRDNLFGVLLLPDMAYELSGQEVLDQIAKFSPAMQQTKEMTDLKTKAEQKMKTEVGQPCIDIVQNNAEGQPVSLKSVIGNPANKYTLVDFWASWCGPCMSEVPYLVETYKKFHDKGFEIYGVSFDNDREKWLGAVKDHELGWIHVSDLKGFDNQAAKDYAVQGIPSNFLIDAQGTIVASNLRGEELQAKIAELLQ